jgi:hypothetical protein
MCPGGTAVRDAFAGGRACGECPPDRAGCSAAGHAGHRAILKQPIGLGLRRLSRTFPDWKDNCDKPRLPAASPRSRNDHGRRRAAARDRGGCPAAWFRWREVALPAGVAHPPAPRRARASTEHSEPVGIEESVAQPMLSTEAGHLGWTAGATGGTGRSSREEDMNPRHYVDLKDNSRDLQPTYFFMINCLLYSRMETGLVSNQDYYDEDVNVYLAHLLHSFINPEYVAQSKRFLSKYDTDVFRRLSGSTDARLKYQIYKTNADFLLVSIGIFDSPTIAGTTRSRMQPSEEAYIGRGKTYYHFAYTYSQQMHRKNAGVSEVLEKLSTGFEKYLRILSHMRGEYLDLMKRFSQGEVYHLERTIDEHQQQELIKVKQDELLELYSAWRSAPTAATEESLERVVSEIRQLNPGFKFELPKR